MGNPAKNPSRYTEILGFLDNLFEGIEEGYVYTPTKNPKTAYWQEYYFQWPQQREQIATHLLSQSKELDCYVAPSIFKAPSAKKQSWLGSNFIWIEFDGNAPSTTPDGIPAPSIRVQSSEPGHEHWYWRLDSFETDKRVAEGLSQRLAYTLNADRSGWDCNQVLRPPGTRHQESKRLVRLITSNVSKHNMGDFTNLVEVDAEQDVQLGKLSDIPDIKEVFAKYKWDDETLVVFNRKVDELEGKRSSAMTRIAFDCLENGMPVEAVYSVLYNCDERWGKYKNRPDRQKRLLGLIKHCISQLARKAEIGLSSKQDLPVFQLGDFLAADYKVNWIYQDLLLEDGFALISSAPGIGKSTLSLRFAMHASLGMDFLIWKFVAETGVKVGFLSFEMTGAECKKIISDMLIGFAPEQQEIVKKNITIVPLGYAMSLDNKDNQQKILDIIDGKQLDVVIIDSLKAVTGLDEKRTDKFMDWVNEEVRNKRKCIPWVIHHNRKPSNEGPRKPKDLSDIYGSTYVTAHPTAVISLHRVSKRIIEVQPFKIRLSEQPDPFTIERLPHLGFLVKSRLQRHEADEDEEGGEQDGLNPRF